MRLTVTPRDGLVVVVPKRWRGNAEQIVASKREWAENALARVAYARALHAGGAEALLPDLVELRLAGETWPVEYRAGAEGSGRAQARTHGSALVVAGDVGDADACLAALSRWLDRTSRELLLPLLAEVAADAGIGYASARIRHQRTRWGSCSARKTISLNRSLVFLPEDLVRALMLHELAHVAVMDHSARFWNHLATLDPHFAEHRAALRDGARFVPAWADA